MLCFSFALLLLVNGVWGQEVDCRETPMTKCGSRYDVRALIDMKDLRITADRLPSVCTGLKQFLECSKDIIRYCGTGNFVISGIMSRDDFDNLLEFVNEVCDSASEVHQIYLKNIGCIINVMDNKRQKCIEGSIALYRDFRAYYNNHNGIETSADKLRSERECIMANFVTQCTTDKLEEACSADAVALVRDVYHTMNVMEHACPGDTKMVLESKVPEFFARMPDHEVYLAELFGS